MCEIIHIASKNIVVEEARFHLLWEYFYFFTSSVFLFLISLADIDDQHVLTFWDVGPFAGNSLPYSLHVEGVILGELQVSKKYMSQIGAL